MEEKTRKNSERAINIQIWYNALLLNAFMTWGGDS